jgi:hypothetical protein
MAEQKYQVQDLHAQTARIGWQEIEKHFARGVVMRVDEDLDLVEVATGLANDDKTAVEGWIRAGQVEHLGTAMAKRWAECQPELWAVVVAPWVVVQERSR